MRFFINMMRISRMGCELREIRNLGISGLNRIRFLISVSGHFQNLELIGNWKLEIGNCTHTWLP